MISEIICIIAAAGVAMIAILAWRDGQLAALRKKVLQAERVRAETALAIADACREIGDNDWPEDLHPADVIEKHVLRPALSKIRELEYLVAAEHGSAFQLSREQLEKTKATISMLRRRISDATLDTARLNYLEENHLETDASGGWLEEPTFGITRVVGNRNDRQFHCIGRGETLREAIDAARFSRPS